MPYWTLADIRRSQAKDRRAPVVVGEAKGSRGRARAAQGINVSMTFVYHPDGTMIDGFRADEIRKNFAEFCRGWEKKHRMPYSWFNDTHPEFKQALFKHLRARFPECQLGHNNSIPEMIGQTYYQVWRRDRIKQHEKNHEQDKNGVTPAGSMRRRTKRGKSYYSILTRYSLSLFRPTEATRERRSRLD